ncbi:hypothetical protein E0H26_23845 [Micromonospora zingiberis]|uniref:DUF5666 domain-containing protein n=1 Tax=Micromonospora zingiberis TaxID=2053011 RepID=A0A4R0GBD1_9ACTN|nr:hypothetical protein [Micromonospora zingiberis]TCB92689.1 hypothetical protein E0H26_23845 [Micromonospora zingiberis]
MARRRSVTATGALLVAITLGATGCGVNRTGPDTAAQAAFDVVAAMGAEGQALAALGFDPAELDPEPAASEPSTEPSATPGRTREERAEEWRKRRAARVLLRRDTLHGEAVVQTRDGGTKTIAVQRGEVTAVEGDKITIRSTDGFTQTWTLAADLRVIERRKTIQPTDIKVGTTLGVAGAKTGDSPTARLIVVPFTQN